MSVYTPKDAVPTETLGLICKSKEEFDRIGLDALKDLSLDTLLDLFVVKYNGNVVRMTQTEFIARTWDDTEHELLNRLYFFNVLKFVRTHRMNSFDMELLFVADKDYANN